MALKVIANVLIFLFNFSRERKSAKTYFTDKLWQPSSTFPHNLHFSFNIQFDSFVTIAGSPELSGILPSGPWSWSGLHDDESSPVPRPPAHLLRHHGGELVHGGLFLHRVLAWKIAPAGGDAQHQNRVKPWD